MSEKNKKKHTLNIEITEEVAEGQYANLAIVNHSSSEFILDFVNVMPTMKKSHVKSRIIINPLHAKRLQQMLTEHLKTYENYHGKIVDLSQQQRNQEQKVSIPLNYGGEVGEA